MIGRLALGILGLGFLALIVFELRVGVAGAKFGAADLSHHPGTFSFFLALQALIAASLFAGAFGRSLLSVRRPIVIGAFAIILSLFGWTVVEIARDMLALGAGMPLTDRLIYGGLAVVAMTVLVTIGYQFIWLEIRDRLR